VNDTVIAFIGAGNMASSMIGGLLARGWSAAQLRASDPLAESRERIGALGVPTTDDNRAAAEPAAVIVLAVKPQQLRQVCKDIAPIVKQNGALVISIAAGIETASLLAWLLFATAAVSPAGRDTADNLLQSIGTVAWVEREELLHGVTALSGSGPAYFFLMMEAMQQAGESLGLDPEMSRALTAQTALGAARMALESGADVIDLRRRVTSPGGTTERAIRVLEERGLRRMLDSALEAAAARSRELAEELGQV
jgi:pyrroline-5-carboxylate reductase